MQHGHITVTTAGTPVNGDDQSGKQFYLAAHPDNTGTIWILSDGETTEGFPLYAGLSGVLVKVDDNLNDLDFDASVSGEKVCWMEAP